MKLYSIQGFSDLLFSKWDDLDIKIRNKNLVFDKCNWVLHHILKKSYAQGKVFNAYVNINSKTFKRYLGDSHYKIIVDVLVKIGVIRIDDTYSSGNFSKSYMITEQFLQRGFVQVEVITKTFDKTLNERLDKDFERIYSVPLFRKLYDNLCKIKVYEDFDYYVERLLDSSDWSKRIKRYSAYFDDLKSLNDAKNPLKVYQLPINFKPTISKNGRVYYLGASIPRIIRRMLRTKSDDLIYEVDMSSAQYSLLFLEYINQKNSSDRSKEVEFYFNLVSNGNIYSYIQSCSSSLAELEYSQLKLELLKALNAKQSPSAINRELRKIFPGFMSWLNNLKVEKGHKYISKLGQGLESKLFVESYMDIPNDVFCLLIHDCILTDYNNVGIVREVLKENLKRMFPNVILNQTSIEDVFKITSVSLNESESPKKAFQDYMDEIKEDLPLLNEFLSS